MSTKKEKAVKIVPRGKYVLVRPDNEESRESAHGILVPDAVEQEQRSQGIVIAVGGDIDDIEEGDKVVYGTYAGENLKLMETGKKIDYKLLHTDDIIAFIK